uniref:hypothetical protein n=1 Tax=Alloprevotella sp. TaxID=1872471 RepID=UPI004025C220
MENEIDESRFFFGKCRCRLASERRAACNRVSARMRPRLHPEAVASAPAFVNKHREQIGGDDSAAPICRHPKYGATLFSEK